MTDDLEKYLNLLLQSWASGSGRNRRFLQTAEKLSSEHVEH